MAVFNPFDFFLEPNATKFPFAYDAQLAEELRPYLVAQAPGERLAAFLGRQP